LLILLDERFVGSVANQKIVSNFLFHIHLHFNGSLFLTFLTAGIYDDLLEVARDSMFSWCTGEDGLPEQNSLPEQYEFFSVFEKKSGDYSFYSCYKKF
jgi:hypothetical protein